MTAPRKRARSLGVVAVLGLVVLTGACRDGDGADASTDAVPDDTTIEATTTEVPTTSTAPVGEVVSRYSLQVGDCVNVYDDLDVITRVPCDQPHDREVFHTEQHPAPHGEPYPGDREMQRYALSVCYAQFQAFAGTLYEVSRLDIGAITPNKTNFEDNKARYRGITCYVHDTSRAPLVGSMRGRGE